VSGAESAFIVGPDPRSPEQLKALFAKSLDMADADGRLLVFVAQTGELRANALVILSCELKWMGQVVGFGIAAARRAGASEADLMDIVTMALESERG
jgi:hypothetical protein